MNDEQGVPTGLNLLNLPAKNFIDAVLQLSDDEVQALLDNEKATLKRDRYIRIMEGRLKGDAAKVEDMAEEDDIVLEDGKAFVIKDGKKELYTSTSMPEEFEPDPYIDSPKRKKKAMDLL